MDFFYWYIENAFCPCLWKWNAAINNYSKFLENWDEKKIQVSKFLETQNTGVRQFRDTTKILYLRSNMCMQCVNNKLFLQITACLCEILNRIV